MATYEQAHAGYGTCSGYGRAMEWEDEDEFEYESSHEMEDEDEWGDILDGVAKGIGGLFGETEDELTHESAHEIVHEGEEEDEACFGKLAKIAASGVPSPALAQLARRAAGSAMRAVAPSRSLEAVLSALSEAEMETEHALEGEDEDELNPVRKVYLDAMMEHLAHAAAEAETEAEAEAFLAPLASLAVKALPKMLKAAPTVIKAVSKAVPHMAKAAQGVAKVLRQNPATRPMTRILPTAIKRGAATLARHAAAGHHVTPVHARKAIAQHSARIIRNPHQAVNIYRHARAMDRNYHRLRPAHHHAHAVRRRPQHGVGGQPHLHTGVHPMHRTVQGRRPVTLRTGHASGYVPPHARYVPMTGQPQVIRSRQPQAFGYRGGHVPGAGAPVTGYVGGTRCQCTCVPI